MGPLLTFVECACLWCLTTGVRLKTSPVSPPSSEALARAGGYLSTELPTVCSEHRLRAVGEGKL